MTVKEMARMGGKARAKSLTKTERKRSARNAALARWAKKRLAAKS